jgi:hypothetical protein
MARKIQPVRNRSRNDRLRNPIRDGPVIAPVLTLPPRIIAPKARPLSQDKLT